MTIKTLKIIVVNFTLSYILSLLASFLFFLSNLKSIVGLLIAGNFLVVSVLSLCSLTIILNRNNSILESPISSFLTFFLVPSAVSIALFNSANSLADKKFYLISILSFSTVLILSFIWFRLDYSRGRKDRRP
jgi:putative effector of murein hydrolase LrgA (UPF0299 family)